MSQDAGPKAPAPDLARVPEGRRLPKRFYKDVVVTPRGEGHVVLLDGRPIRSPGKLVLVLPTPGMAEAIAAEWAQQGEHIDPQSMPLTRLAHSVRDQVDGREREVRADLLRYAGSDLLCYRAESPEGLRRAQAAAWDPILDWARTHLDADLAVGAGLMPIEQSPASRSAISAAIAPLESFHLASAHVMTTLLGSILLALATLGGRLSPEAAWTAAHVDEDWQMAQWGADAEAMRRQEFRRAEFMAAFRLSQLAGNAKDERPVRS